MAAVQGIRRNGAVVSEGAMLFEVVTASLYDGDGVTVV
jgi:hypothetical protein